MFPAWFCFVVFLLSRFGWASLAAAYPSEGKPEQGATYRGRSGRVGGVSYNHCLNVTITPEGIYMVLRWMFRLCHPPVLLPWAGVQSVNTESHMVFGQTILRFADAAGRKLTLSLPADALAELRAAGGRSFA